MFFELLIVCGMFRVCQFVCDDAMSSEKKRTSCISDSHLQTAHQFDKSLIKQ